mmetsp:Transcript_77888/g.167070  ORF Transcript_77888/g.167070 Transcript_77888/m.167070 type:complete len:229 (+) Transcript_77888:1765-2451(+)
MTSSSGPIFSWKHCSSWASQNRGERAASRHAGTAPTRAARSCRRTKDIKRTTTPRGQPASRAMCTRAAQTKADGSAKTAAEPGSEGATARSSSARCSKGARQSGHCLVSNSRAQGRWNSCPHTAWPSEFSSRTNGLAQGAPRRGPASATSFKLPRQITQTSSGQQSGGADDGASSQFFGSGKDGCMYPSCVWPQRHRKSGLCETSIAICFVLPRAWSQASQRLFLIGL